MSVPRSLKNVSRHEKSLFRKRSATDDAEEAGRIAETSLFCVPRPPSWRAESLVRSSVGIHRGTRVM